MRRIPPLLFSWLALLSFAVSADAAAIVWGPASTISGDTDVSTLGTLERAFRVGSTGVSSVTVNGVTFSPFVVTGNTTVGTTSLGSSGGFGANTGVFGSASAPFSSLSASYRTLLDSSANGNAIDTVTLTLSGLTFGLVYQFQWWVNDSRDAGGPTRQTISTATNSVSLEHNVQNLEGGVGQFVIGTFTADATSQLITFTGTSTGIPTAAPQINAFQLRVIPEPSTIALLLFGSVAVLHRFARRK